MTDKQIIIDVVDVAGCEFYNKDDKTCREVNGKYDTDICEFDKCENSNCNYKQLKRKEQELKNICKTFDIEYLIDKETGNLIGRCNKLYKKEQECEELKNTITNLENIRDEFSAKLDQLKQILAKIKEICNNNDELQGDFNLVDCDKYKLGKHNLANKILQKIIEREVNNE